MSTTSSLDTNQKIYIDEKDRNELFDKIISGEYKEEYAFNTECLERYCLGKTYLPDYAYSHIRSLLKKEFKQYKLDNGIKDKPELKSPKNNKNLGECTVKELYDYCVSIRCKDCFICKINEEKGLNECFIDNLLKKDLEKPTKILKDIKI